MPVKHIFVTGGVVSSLGKGITAASLGLLLKARGLRVAMQKIDPYINVDPGTMNPFQHGEVFVTDDGTETDLDLGHYERFVDINMQRESNVTTGVVYGTIIARERKGEFLGATVQVIPHITDEIKRRILALVEDGDIDVAISEIGGTVGDIESLPFLEAVRQLKKDLGHENVCYIHVTLVPFLETSRELKTKPTQHSVKELKSIGIQPDAIVCRSDRPITKDVKEKISLFCDTDIEAVVTALNAETIYEVPLMLNEEGLDEYIVKHLGLPGHPPDLSEWSGLVERIKDLSSEVRIAVVGKYVDLPDAYISIAESLNAAGIKHGVKVKPVWVASDTLVEGRCGESLKSVHTVRARERNTFPRTVPRAPVRGHRVLQERRWDEGGQLLGVRPRHRLPGDRPDGPPERRRRAGRYHEARALPVQDRPRNEGRRRVRRGGHLREAQAPLRGEQCPAAQDGGGRAHLLWPLARRQAG
jgi:CTP synthase